LVRVNRLLSVLLMAGAMLPRPKIKPVIAYNVTSKIGGSIVKTGVSASV